MKTIYLIGAIVLTISAGAAAYWGPDHYRVWKAKDGARQLLIDPESAVFTQIMFSSEAVCGMVNSRNRLGAMAGAVPFLAINDKPVELAPVNLLHSEEEQNYLDETCDSMRSLSYSASRPACNRAREARNQTIAFYDWMIRAQKLCDIKPRDDAPEPAATP